MAHIRIRCRATRNPASGSAGSFAYPRINGLLPDMSDVDVKVIADNGDEVAILYGVSAITWQCATDGQPARATLTLIDADVELDALAELPSERPTAPELPE